MAYVPCDGCTACCRGERVILAPSDDPSTYLTVPAELDDGTPALMLDHKPNGDCIYLEDGGCSIHDRAPWACREFDCVKWWLATPEACIELLTPDDHRGEVLEAGIRLFLRSDYATKIRGVVPHDVPSPVGSAGGFAPPSAEFLVK